MSSRTLYHRKAKAEASDKMGPQRMFMHWTDDLHQCFLDAVEQHGGLYKATPTEVTQAMAMPNVTLIQVKSHLQYHRLLGLGRGHASEGMPSNTDGSSSSEAEEEADPLTSIIDVSSRSDSEAEEESEPMQMPPSNANVSSSEGEEESEPVPPSNAYGSFSEAEEESEPMPPSDVDVSSLSENQRRIDELLEERDRILERDWINLERQRKNLEREQRKNLEMRQLIRGMGSTTIRGSESSEEDE